METRRLRVEPISFSVMLGCTVRKEAGEHFRASVSGYVSEEEETRAMEERGLDLVVRACLEDGSEPILFQGPATRISVRYEGALRRMTIEAASYSILLDDGPRTRSFQEAGQTYRTIIDCLREQRERFGVIDSVGRGVRPGHIVVQYRESDWGFLKRLAAELGEVVMADCMNPYPCLYFGWPDRSADIKRLEAAAETSRCYGGFTQTGGSLECTKESREQLELGDFVETGGQRYRIWSMESRLEAGEVLYEYRMRRVRERDAPAEGMKRICGVSLFGEVADVEGSRVRVRLQTELDWDGGDGIWYSYATVYSGGHDIGWYCMPEKGERVRLFFPDSDEGHAYVVGAVHRPQDKARMDPDRKSFKTRHNKEICFTPDEILITNHQGLSISLRDGEGIEIDSNRGITLDAGAFIGIESGSEVVIEAGESVRLQQGRNMLMVRDGIREIGRNIEHN